MRILVLQHIDVEHPGVFREFFAADGIAWDAVELDTGGTIPPLERYDMLWAMGGPMDVWEEERLPWLRTEKQAIREAVLERGMPFVGFCLGHQLLAEALGGRVGKMPAAEVGILDVELTEAGRRDPLFRGFAPECTALQWHGAAVIEPPPGAEVLASSPLCAVQAFRAGEHAYGIQYHVEIGPDTVREWGSVAEYGQSLEATLGPGAMGRLETQLSGHLGDFRRDARRLYDNLMDLVNRD